MRFRLPSPEPSLELKNLTCKSSIAIASYARWKGKLVSVAQHLKIKLSEYDQRIRTFIPNYEEMLTVVAATALLVGRRNLTIVDLGIGTGALAARCLGTVPNAHLYGIDSDPDILALAQRRLSRKRSNKVNLRQGNFLETPLPRCDAIVATLALHHINAVKIKRQLYAKCFAALRRGGIFSNGDCFLTENAILSQRYMEIWQAHLRKFYSRRRTKEFFTAWAKEDTYFPLGQEVKMLSEAGFETEVVWRRAPFAVLLGWKP
jgi:tRNA (cmo5U34)-methyltransferase